MAKYKYLSSFTIIHYPQVEVFFVYKLLIVLF